MTSSIKTAVLFAMLTTLFVIVGGLIGGQSGMMIALIFAVIMNFFSYYFSDSIVLKMYKAKELQRSDAPQLHEIVKNSHETPVFPNRESVLFLTQAPMPLPPAEIRKMPLWL